MAVFLWAPAEGAGRQVDRRTGSAAELCHSLIAGLDRRSSDLDSHTVTYACVVYGPRPGETPAFEIPVDAEEPDRVELIKVATVFKSGAVYRVHEQAIWTRRSPEEAGTIATFTSDGSQFHTRFASTSGPRSTLMLDLTDAMHRVGSQMDAYGWRVLGQVAPIDYQQYMRWGATSPDLRVVSRADDQAVIQWRFLPELPQTRMTATIDERAQALKAIRMEFHGGDADAPNARVSLRKEVQFREHRIGSRSVLGARVTDQLNDAGEEWPATWALVRVTPIAIEATSRRREEILLEPREGDLVQDSRFDIAYPYGDERVNLDGLIVGLKSRAEADVGWELDRWVQELPALLRASAEIRANVQGESGSAEVVAFDAGAVLVEGSESATAEYRFVVRNESSVTWNVVDVVKSCGAQTCELSARTIPPGAEASLHVIMTVPSPGERHQEVALVFDDGSVRKFELRARGFSPGRLRVLSSGFVRRGEQLQAEVRAYWVESEMALADALAAPLTIDAQEGVSLRFDGWTEIETASSDGQRPRKLFGRGVVALGADADGGRPEGHELIFRVGDQRSFRLPVATFDSGVAAQRDGAMKLRPESPSDRR